MKDSTSWTIIIVVIIIVAGVVFYLAKTPSSASTTNINVDVDNPQPTINMDDNVPTEQASGPECTTSVSPKTSCSGDAVVGKIHTAVPNTLCAIYLNYNGMGPNLLSNAATDSSGDYSTTQNPTAPGTYVFSVACGSCVDQDTLTVRFCI